MNIKIIEDDVLSNIENDFQKQYPFLKLQFDKRSPTEGKSLPEEDKLPIDTPLEDATFFHCPGSIDIGGRKNGPCRGA